MPPQLPPVTSRLIRSEQPLRAPSPQELSWPPPQPSLPRVLPRKLPANGKSASWRTGMGVGWGGSVSVSGGFCWCMRNFPASHLESLWWFRSRKSPSQAKLAPGSRCPQNELKRQVVSHSFCREAARECRRKKKEYVKCLENRVAVLENQNKTLIEELKALKDLYCHKSE